jgi:CheY-like chemotaxis protein
MQLHTEALSPTAEQLEKVGVLVVDDSNLVRTMVQLCLERSGFNVWAASSGREAIDLYREHQDHIAVVLLDVQMPGLDGPATLDCLRELNSEIVACFMSGDTGAYRPEDLIRRSAAPIIAKPFMPSDLVDTLWHVAHGASTK